MRNSPDDPGRSAAADAPSTPPRVLFAGWLDFDRGLRELVELARAGAIHLVVAGEGDVRVLELLARTNNVDYRGFCSHAQIMDLTAACDYVAAFYNPARTINRYAASNKIAEALAVGRPVLINRELMVASRLIEAGTAVAVPYARIDTLALAIQAHLRDPVAYRNACAAARRLYETDYHAAQVRRTTLDALMTTEINSWPSTTTPSR